MNSSMLVERWQSTIPAFALVLLCCTCVVGLVLAQTARQREMPGDSAVRDTALEAVQASTAIVSWHQSLIPLKVRPVVTPHGGGVQCAARWLSTLQQTVAILNRDREFVRLVESNDSEPDVSLLFTSVPQYLEYTDKLYAAHVAPKSWVEMLRISDPIERFGHAPPVNDVVFLVGDTADVRLAVAFVDLSNDAGRFLPCQDALLAENLLMALSGQTGMLAIGLSNRRFGRGHFLDVVAPAMRFILHAQYDHGVQKPSGEELQRRLGGVTK